MHCVYHVHILMFAILRTQKIRKEGDRNTSTAPCSVVLACGPIRTAPRENPQLVLVASPSIFMELARGVRVRFEAAPTIWDSKEDLFPTLRVIDPAR